ncbi:hypothetical protein HY638_03410 [Candidatus Woesearchaeota archaeon]|nr:hypothetical protein [Candidatus Woesearchaeota archaeon]
MVAQIQYETGMPVVEKQSTPPLPHSRIDRGLESLMSGYTITGINDAGQRYHSGSTYTSQIMPSLGSLRKDHKRSLASELGVIEKDLERKLSQFGEYSPEDVKTYERLKRLQLQFKGIVEASRKELESEREFLALCEIDIIKADSQLRAYDGFDVANNERYKKLASVKNSSEEITEKLRSSIAVKEHYISQYEKVTRELSDFRYRKVLIVDNVKDKLMAVRYLKGRVNVAEEKKSVFSRIKEGYQNIKDKVQDYVPRFQIGGYSPIKVGTALGVLLIATCAAKPAYNTISSGVKSEPISGAKTIEQSINERYHQRQDAAPRKSVPEKSIPTITGETGKAVVLKGVTTAAATLSQTTEAPYTLFSFQVMNEYGKPRPSAFCPDGCSLVQRGLSKAELPNPIDIKAREGDIVRVMERPVVDGKPIMGTFSEDVGVWEDRYIYTGEGGSQTTVSELVTTTKKVEREVGKLWNTKNPVRESFYSVVEGKLEPFRGVNLQNSYRSKQPGRS